MWKTALLLLFTLVILPVAAFYLDQPLTHLRMSVLQDLVLIYLVAAVLCFAASTITRNYSQVDKLWSIMPMVYTWYVAVAADFHWRLVLMALLVSVWGIRLTLNFARRGGYSIRIWDGVEDYRWAILQRKPEFKATWKWVLFNLFFISLYQMGLILLMTLPAVRSINGRPFGWWDALLAAIFLILVTIETIADQQQWSFQQKKHQLQKSGGDVPPPYKKGFVDSGLWGIVRHPNYAAEQAIWITFYFFSVSATGKWLNWSLIGSLLLVLLFRGSSNFSESISAGKYPDYKEYQKRVPRFLPFR